MKRVPQSKPERKATAKRPPGVPSSAEPAARQARREEASPEAVIQPDQAGIVPREEIARLAHSYWEARGDQGGSPEGDWLRAEQTLKARQAKK